MPYIHKFLNFFKPLAIVALLATIPLSAQAAEVEGAKEFVRKVSNRALEVMGGSANASQKEEKLAKLFVDVVDTQWIGRFVLGKYWKAATKQQKDKYSIVYRKFLIGSYVPKFREYTDEKIKILGASANGNNEFLVKTEIVRKGNPAIKIDYRIRESNGKLQIFDVVAEGVSLITTQRSEFDSVVSQNGLDYLLDRLTERVKQMSLTKPHLSAA